MTNFKEENFDVSSLLQSTPSAFTYAFGVSNNFALTYNDTDTAPYFYVRSYDKFNSEYTSITPDMIDSVYDVSKAESVLLPNRAICLLAGSDSSL